MDLQHYLHWLHLESTHLYENERLLMTAPGESGRANATVAPCCLGLPLRMARSGSDVNT
jgi:hypothetical protein